jgi:hypothetical protein
LTTEPGLEVVLILKQKQFCHALESQDWTVAELLVSMQRDTDFVSVYRRVAGHRTDDQQQKFDATDQLPQAIIEIARPAISQMMS